MSESKSDALPLGDSPKNSLKTLITAALPLLQNLSAGAAANPARHIRACSTATAAIPLVLLLPWRTLRTRRRRSRSSATARTAPATPDGSPLLDTACKPLLAGRFPASNHPRYGPAGSPAPSEGRALSSKSYFVSIPDG